MPPGLTSSSPTPPSNETITTKSSSVDSNGRSADDLWVKSEGRLGPHHHHIDPLTAHDDTVDVNTDYSYVQFARSRPSVHEYSYPTLDTVSSKSPQQRQDSIGEIKKHNNWSDVHTSQPAVTHEKEKARPDEENGPEAKWTLVGQTAGSLRLL